MTAPQNSLLKVLRLHAPWMAALLLCQCELPPRQAWQYIQSNGLLSYWNQGAAQPSPPFGAGPGHEQRFAASRNSYLASRYGYARGANFYYPRSSIPARPSTPLASRYYGVPSPDENRAGPARPTTPARPRPRPEPPAVTRIPVEEPVVRHEPSEPRPSTPTVASRANGSAPAPVKPADSGLELPYGTSVPGRPNMVNSPYAGKTQLVDVSGMTAGQTVKCPYTGKLFKVPSSQQAANTAEPKLESKLDAPKMSSEPKSEDKKP